MLLTTTSQRNEIQTQPQNSYKQIQQSGDQSNVQIQILPTYQNYHIFKKSKPCDILYPCKKNYFEKKLSDKERDNSEQEWTIMEESNYFYNYCCSQYRSFKLCAKYGSVEQYVGRRSKNVFCQDILMEITKQGEQEKIGEIQAISPEFKTECKKSFIYTKPLIKIVYFVNNVEAQVLVITLAKTTFHNYYLRQCCLPYSEIIYNIYEKNKEQASPQIGDITNKFQGCSKEYCTRGDQFQIDMTKKIENKDIEALIMFGCLQLTYQEYEQMIKLP
ncbi:unnamed protein product [Paramecium octaurelia]|uniref:Phospholipid scramblase n=1 Tax=Paramecium octaurelia TaxID=43137 RepID=A0A8S1WSZ4_PAROT|nr:unnamed protein product [Paramecium octaurelia]